MKRILTVLLLFCFLFPTTQAQSPYRFKFPQEAAWTGGALAGIGLSFVIQSKNHTFTPAQIAALDPKDIPAFDRFVTRQYSLKAQRGSDRLLYSGFAVPTLILLDPEIRQESGEMAVLVGETFLLNTALTMLVKQLVHRPRPFTYNPNVPMAAKLERDARLSFFSGHTSTTAALTFVTARIWADFHPDSRWKPAIWAGAALLPVTVGLLRVKGGKHFLSDVVVGLGVGALSGLAVPFLHHR